METGLQCSITYSKERVVKVKKFRFAWDMSQCSHMVCINIPQKKHECLGLYSQRSRASFYTISSAYLPCPPRFPDLPSIKHMWHMMDRRLVQLPGLIKF